MLIDAGVMESIWKLCLVMALSSLIGLEREMQRKGAGLRTHVLMGIGSALLVLTSLRIFETYYTLSTNIDPTRMLAGIVTGIGVLCAGSIMRGGAGITGMTTAATLWISSGIGIAVASGIYVETIFTTVVVFVVLVVMGRWERRFRKNEVHSGNYHRQPIKAGGYSNGTSSSQRPQNYGARRKQEYRS